MPKPRKIATIIKGVLGLLVVALLAGTVYAGNRLFDFALDPHAADSMSSQMDSGKVDTGSSSDPARDADYRAEATAWFKAAKRSVSHRAADGTELLGWRVDAGDDASGSHDYAILCHGYSNTPESMAKYAYRFHQRGMSVLAPAARAHERNIDTGYIQMGWQDSADLTGWIDDIVSRDPDARIILYGISMGGSEVMMAAGRELPENVRLIIEDCGYSSVRDEFLWQYKRMFNLPTFPLFNVADAICRVRAGYTFEEASAITQLKRAKVPMLFIHGTDDAFVPFSMLDEEYDACASPVKQKLTIEGAGHAQSASTDPERYWSTIASFIDQHL